MEGVALIENDRMPWFLVKEIFSYKNSSVHNFNPLDISLFQLKLKVRSFMNVSYFGGYETIIKGREIISIMESLNKNHPEWVSRTPNFLIDTTTILKLFRKSVREYLDQTPLIVTETSAFDFVWVYISDIYSIIHDGCKSID